jgi:hypothetical protein
MYLYNLHNYIIGIIMLKTSNLKLAEDDTKQGTTLFQLYQYLAL